MEARKSLVTKLAEVMGEIDHVEKRGRNDFQKYNYVKAADLANAVRQKLASRNIIMLSDVVEVRSYEVPAKEGVMQAIDLKVKYTFYDGDSDTSISFHGYGSGTDKGDKSAYKAHTGALKYALRNAFLVPDESDPEADTSVDKATSEKKAKDDNFLKCEKCGRNVTPYTKPDGTKVTLVKVMDAGRQKWNKDLCGGCQIQLTREERESREHVAKPEPKAEVPMNDPELVQAEDGGWWAQGTVTQVFHGPKAFSFKLGTIMFTCWHKTLVPHFVSALKKKVEFSYKVSPDGKFKNVERLTRVDGKQLDESAIDDTYIQEHEIANA